MTQSNRDEAGPLPLADAAELTEIWGEFAPPLRAFLGRRVPPGSTPRTSFRRCFCESSDTPTRSAARNGPRPGCSRLPATPCGTHCAFGCVATVGPMHSTLICPPKSTRPRTAWRKPSLLHVSRR